MTDSPASDSYYCAKCYTKVPDGDDEGTCEKCHANLWHMGALFDESDLRMAKQAKEREMQEWANLNNLGKP